MSSCAMAESAQEMQDAQPARERRPTTMKMKNDKLLQAMKMKTDPRTDQLKPGAACDPARNRTPERWRLPSNANDRSSTRKRLQDIKKLRKLLHHEEHVTWTDHRRAHRTKVRRGKGSRLRRIERRQNQRLQQPKKTSDASPVYKPEPDERPILYNNPPMKQYAPPLPKEPEPTTPIPRHWHTASTAAATSAAAAVSAASPRTCHRHVCPSIDRVRRRSGGTVDGRHESWGGSSTWRDQPRDRPRRHGQQPTQRTHPIGPTFRRSGMFFRERRRKPRGR